MRNREIADMFPIGLTINQAEDSIILTIESLEGHKIAIESEKKELFVTNKSSIN